MTAPSNGISRVERLVRATPELVGEVNLDRVLQRVADLARELLEAGYAAVGLLTPDSESLASFTTSGVSVELEELIGKLPAGKGILGLVVREGQVVRLNDPGDDSAAVGVPPHNPPLRSFLAVPVVGPQGVIGDLYLTEKIGSDEFTAEDIHIAMLLAAIVASAVENARDRERTSRLLDEVQQLHRSRERFFSMVNHELRNSLAAVYGWAEMLVRRKDPQSVPRGAYEILEAADQSIALLNDLLDLNRIDEDRLKIVIKDVDCGATVRSSIQRVLTTASEKEVEIQGPSQDQRLVCRTDAHRVEQILVNLLTNAIKHTPPRSTIRVSLDSRPLEIVIQVTDQGPGVPDGDVERIFDIYYSAGGPGRSTGHGVGLALSRKLARLLGGGLTATDTGGEGGLFVLTLPAQD